jgi:hypothetical protein
MFLLRNYQTHKEYEFLQKNLSDLMEDEIFDFITYLTENEIDFIISGSVSLYINGLLGRKIKDIDINMDTKNFEKLINLKNNHKYSENKDYDKVEEERTNMFELLFLETKPKKKSLFPKMCKKMYKYHFSKPELKIYPWDDGFSITKYDIFVSDEGIKEYNEVNGIKIMWGWSMVKIKMLINFSYRNVKNCDGFDYKTKMKHLDDTIYIIKKLQLKNNN